MNVRRRIFPCICREHHIVCRWQTPHSCPVHGKRNILIMVIRYTCDIIKHHPDKYLVFVFQRKFQSLRYPTQLHIIICPRHDGRKSLAKNLFSILTIKSFCYEMIPSINFFQETWHHVNPCRRSHFAVYHFYLCGRRVICLFEFYDILFEIFG